MAEQPLVAVHLVILRQVVCHDCGWSSMPTELPGEAEAWADEHSCADT